MFSNGFCAQWWGREGLFRHQQHSGRSKSSAAAARPDEESTGFITEVWPISHKTHVGTGAQLAIDYGPSQENGPSF